MTSRPTARRFLACAGACALLVLDLGGCTRLANGPSVPAARSTGALASLRREAERQERRPNVALATAPVPTGVEPLLGQVIPADDPKAHLSLDAVIDRMAGNTPTPTGEAHPGALRRYIDGRAKLLEGNAAGAAEDLRAATELDPSACEPWRELGEAQLALGQRADAVRSFRAAAAAGPCDARTLEFLGRSAMERGDVEEAGTYLARAYLRHPAGADPSLPSIIGVSLARALAAQGYTVAAVESLRSVINRPAQLTSTTRYSAELGAIFRRQGDLWRDSGDAMCRLGRYQEAVEAYSKATELPSLDRTPLRPRIVFALVRSGRPARAALNVLDDMAQAHGRVSESDLAALRYVSDHGVESGVLSEALGSLRSADRPPSPSLERDLSLARVRLLSGGAARSALREHLIAHPTDAVAAIDWLNLDRSAADAAATAASLIAARPAAAKLAAEAFLRSRFGAEAVPPPGTSPSSMLFSAYISAKRGRPLEGFTTISGVTTGNALGLAAAAAQIEMAIDAGRPEAAEAPLERLRRAAPSTESRRWLAQCLTVVQRWGEAATILEPVLQAPGVHPADRLDDRLLAADLATKRGKPAEAEQHLTAAAALDPFDERPLSQLMVLYSTEGAAPDASKLNAVVRDLRQNAPDSRTIRMLRARELMRRQQWSQAETELRSMIDAEPGDPGPMELLAATWEGRAKASGAKSGTGATPADGASWLQGHLKRRPQSPLLLAGLAAFKLVSGQGSEAEASLREAFNAGGGPDVSRTLERLLRDSLNRAPEADALARGRLADRPRTIAETLEFAALSVRWEEPLNAVSILSGGLPPDLDLSFDQALQALAIIARCNPDLRKPGASRAASDAARVFERCLTSIPHLTTEVHRRRIETLATAPDTRVDDLLSAVTLWTTQYPQAAATAHMAVVGALVQAQQGAKVPTYLGRAVASSPDDAPLTGLWFQSVAELGDAPAAKAMLDSLHRAGKLRSIAETIAPNLDLDAVHDLRAEFAYMLGVNFAQRTLDPDAAAMYEYALTFDPDHAWACNNLGYSLADRGVDLDRASELLERAYKAKPEEVPIIDSLAWLRYKQGVILDQVDPESGAVLHRGAVSLLREASQKLIGQVDNTIQDHLGDALWLAGQSDEAVAAWSRAAALSRRTLELARGQAQAEPKPPPNAEVVESEAIIESTTLKRDAAAAGNPVRVAPQINNPNPQPAKVPVDKGEPKDAHP